MTDFDMNIRSALDQDGYTDGRTVGITSDDIDSLFAEGFSGLYTAATRSFRGINHFNTGAAVPANYDVHGYTFFTRPRMKLDDRNCIIERNALTYLATSDRLSIPAAIRAYLDPIGSGSPVTTTYGDSSIPKNKYTCPLVDPLSPFISILSNSLVSLTGWPDIDVDTYTESAGLMKEQWSMYDGIAKFNGSFSLNSSHVNMRGDPLGLLFQAWVTYGTNIRLNQNMIPWLDSIMDREKDYETRIYRLIMDPTKTFVQKIACTGASIPTASNTGASYDYDSTRPLNDRNDTISMSWLSSGAIYYDPYTPVAFNITVVDFNPNMYPSNRARVYTKIPRQQRKYFKDEGYPWINTETSELEWYVPNDRYAQVMEQYK